ncbi:MAG: hypothetical protein H6711_16585 [Myxococcales bacterium]|nr:hypothetical protein [Myxococcales bacterium]
MAPNEHATTFLVAAEDRAGYEAVRTLVDRLIASEIPWTQDILDHVRVWEKRSANPLEHPWISSSDAGSGPSRRRVRGHFGGEPGAPDAASTRRLLLNVMERWDDAADHALLIARDLDGDPRRLKGMRQASAERPWPFRIILAWSEPESESWYVAGFTPTNASEDERLRALTAEIGFDPTTAPHRLLSTAKGSPKDTKRVLERLCGADLDRQRECLEVPLDRLAERGREAGIADFLGEVRSQILPLFGAISRA